MRNVCSRGRARLLDVRQVDELVVVLVQRAAPPKAGERPGADYETTVLRGGKMREIVIYPNHEEALTAAATSPQSSPLEATERQVVIGGRAGR